MLAGGTAPMSEPQHRSPHQRPGRLAGSKKKLQAAGTTHRLLLFFGMGLHLHKWFKFPARTQKLPVSRRTLKCAHIRRRAKTKCTFLQTCTVDCDSGLAKPCDVDHDNLADKHSVRHFPQNAHHRRISNHQDTQVPFLRIKRTGKRITSFPGQETKQRAGRRGIETRMEKQPAQTSAAVSTAKGVRASEQVTRTRTVLVAGPPSW